MSQTKPRPHSDGSALRIAGQQPPCHEVNGADVVGVEGVAEAERVGECGGGHEGAVVVEDEGAYCPDDAVEEGDKGDDQEGGEGHTAEVGDLGVVVVEAAECAGFEGFEAGYEGVAAGRTGGGGGRGGRGLESEGRGGRGRLWLLHVSDCPDEHSLCSHRCLAPTFVDSVVMLEEEVS